MYHASMKSLAWTFEDMSAIRDRPPTPDDEGRVQPSGPEVESCRSREGRDELLIHAGADATGQRQGSGDHQRHANRREACAQDRVRNGACIPKHYTPTGLLLASQLAMMSGVWTVTGTVLPCYGSMHAARESASFDYTWPMMCRVQVHRTDSRRLSVRSMAGATRREQIGLGWGFGLGLG